MGAVDGAPGAAPNTPPQPPRLPGADVSSPVRLSRCASTNSLSLGGSRLGSVHRPSCDRGSSSSTTNCSSGRSRVAPESRALSMRKLGGGSTDSLAARQHAAPASNGLPPYIPAVAQTLGRSGSLRSSLLLREYATHARSVQSFIMRNGPAALDAAEPQTKSLPRLSQQKGSSTTNSSATTITHLSSSLPDVHLSNTQYGSASSSAQILHQKKKYSVNAGKSSSSSSSSSSSICYNDPLANSSRNAAGTPQTQTARPLQQQNPVIKRPSFFEDIIQGLYHMSSVRYVTVVVAKPVRKPRAQTLQNVPPASAIDGPARSVFSISSATSLEHGTVLRSETTRKPVLMWVMSFFQLAIMIAVVAHTGFDSPEKNPLLGPKFSLLVPYGAAIPSLVRQDFYSEGWRLIVTIFLHGGFVHLLINISSQLSLGAELERYWGPPRVAFIFFSSALFGAMCTVLIRSTDVVAVGASGGILGLFGASIADMYVNYHSLFRPLLQLTYWSMTIIFMLCIGLIPIMDNITHTSGFLMGFFSGALLIPDMSRGTAPKNWAHWFRVLGILMWASLAVMMLYFLNAHIQPKCTPWCCWLFLSLQC